MSRRIVQIATAAISPASTGDGYVIYLFALDQNGVVWRLDDADVMKGRIAASAQWERLPELPTVPTSPAAAPQESLQAVVERINRTGLGLSTDAPTTTNPAEGREP